MMDPSTIWQWRIKFVKMYSRHQTPFFYCEKIGLDFNIGSNKNQKLDLKSATNGAILEICEFAKTLSKNKYRFISHILENSFDLGFENEQQQSAFSLKIGPKISELKKRRSKAKKKRFDLASFLSECKNSTDDFQNSDENECEEEFNSLNSVENIKVEYESDEMEEMHNPVSECDPPTDDGDHEEEFNSSQVISEERTRVGHGSDGTEHEPNIDEHSEELTNSQMSSKEDKNIEHLSEAMAVAHPDDGREHDHHFACSEPSEELEPSASELKEDLPLSFPLCEQIGMNFEVGSNQRLDPALVTSPVMLELAQVTAILTGSFLPIVLDVLGHNFDIDLKMYGRQIFSKVKRLLERYKKVDRKVRSEFEHEPFSLSFTPSKRIKVSKLFNQSPQYQFKEVTKRRQSELKRKREEMALVPTDELYMHPNQDVGHCYTCPIGESDADSDENMVYLDKVGSQEKVNRESSFVSPSGFRYLESGPLSECVPLLPTERPSGFSPVKPDVDSSESDSDKEQLFASRPQTPTQTNDDVLTERDIEQGALGTDILWKLRVHRVKQIVTLLDKDNCSFFMSKRFGLNYNVGFGLKQKLNIETMNQSALFDVVKFTLAMNASRQDFVMEVLEYNFDLELQDEQQRQIFASEIMKRVRRMRNCDNAIKFSRETFELPDLESLMNQSAVDVKTELIPVPLKPPDSHVEPEEHVSESSELLYPHCKEIGLKLHVNNNQANTKQNINKLTKGAMIEVGKFAEMLCGTFNQVLFDIIEHNYDVDLQSGHSEVAANILAQIAHIVDRRNLPAFRPLNTTLGKICVQTNQDPDSSGVTEQECHINSNADKCSAGTSQTPVTDQHVGNSANRKELNDYDKFMWKQRANHIQHILRIPHVSDCPLYSYSRCKKIGLNFNIGSGLKQILDPNLLTNGVMAEVSAFAAELLAAQKFFITEILEYNFDIFLRNEQYRQVFATGILENLKQLKKYKYQFPRHQSLFRLPFEKCVKFADAKIPSCLKCYEDRTSNSHDEKCDPIHMRHSQTTTGGVLDGPNTPSQSSEMNLTFSSSAAEELIMTIYSRCRKIGLNLCVDKNQRRQTLDMQLLTVDMMIEVADFAKKLCGVTKHDLIADILEQNFNVNIPSRKNLLEQFMKATKQYDGWAAWFSQVFVIQPSYQIERVPANKQKPKRVAAIRKSERSKEAEKRQLALQQETAKVPVTTETSPAEAKKNYSKSRLLQQYDFPCCEKIGLDLDVKSKLGIPKNKLKLNVLTRAVMWEIHKYATRRVKFSPFSQTVYEILDYNFDISSQHCRRWEFSEATASKVQKFAKQFKNNPQRQELLFKLPFANILENVGDQSRITNVQLAGCHPDVNWGSFFRRVQTENDLLFHHEDTEPRSPTSFKYVVPGMIHHKALMQMEGSTVAEDNDVHLHGNQPFITDIKQEEYDPYYET